MSRSEVSDAKILFMLKTESAGGVVINMKGEVALVQHGHTSFWGFPKGHIDEGETPLQAAKREIGEEIGVDDLELIEELGSYIRYKSTSDGRDDTGELKTIHMFLFKTSQEKLAPRDAGHPQAAWIPLDGVEERLTNPKDKEFFRNTLPRIKATSR